MHYTLRFSRPAQSAGQIGCPFNLLDMLPDGTMPREKEGCDVISVQVVQVPWNQLSSREDIPEIVSCWR